MSLRFPHRLSPLLIISLGISFLILSSRSIFTSSLGARLDWHYFTTAQDEKPNAVILILISPLRLDEALLALRNIEDRFNRRLKYPYVLLSEANITEDTQSKVEWITEGRATFGLPSDMWGVPPSLDQERIDASLRNIGFFSGFFWRHPAIAKYDWIWRLDTDINFHCDIPYDPFVRMRDAGALYSFVQISRDAIWIQPSLAGNVSAFIASHANIIPEGVNHAFQWTNVTKALKGEAANEEWTLWNFYNNWEISHRTLWTSEVYTNFFKYLDNAGGFFYERWGDAPVHSFGVSLALRPDQVLEFTDMGYEHKDWPYECPAIPRCSCIRDGERDAFSNNAAECAGPACVKFFTDLAP